MYFITKPKEIRPGLITSMNAAYTVEEIKAVLKQTELKKAIVTKTFMGFEITGDKIQ